MKHLVGTHVNFWTNKIGTKLLKKKNRKKIETKFTSELQKKEIPQNTY